MKFIVCIIFLLFSSCLFSQLAVNEIMPAPLGDEPEWVEIYNFSQNNFKLKDGRIFDAVGSKSLPDIMIKAKEFVILTSDTNALKAARLIADNVFLIETSLPIFNNTSDEVKIISESKLIDTVYYNMGWGKKGISLERIDYLVPALSKENWAASTDESGATCGYANSNAKLDFDAEISSLEYDPENNKYLIFLENTGRKIINSIDLFLQIDFNNNSRFDESEKVFTGQITNLEKLKEIEISENDILNKTINSGRYDYLAFLSAKTDENPLNDSLRGEVYKSYPEGTLVINEVLFDIDEEHAEFAEIFNTSQDTISLKGYGLHDRWKSSGPDYVYFSEDSFIFPGGYAVIAWDSLFFENYPELADNLSVTVYEENFNLNKTNEDLILFDPNGNYVDSLTYYENWHLSGIDTKNASLEKINPTLETNIGESWSTCSGSRGATPLEKNSVAAEQKESGDLTAEPNPFSPFSRGDDSFCIISYSLPYSQAAVTAYIFDTSGRRLRKLKVSVSSSSEGSFVFDGRNDEGYILQPGPYILFFEAADSETGDIWTKKKLIVIGSK